MSVLEDDESGRWSTSGTQRSVIQHNCGVHVVTGVAAPQPVMRVSFLELTLQHLAPQAATVLLPLPVDLEGRLTLSLADDHVFGRLAVADPH